jgi:hypothetical protein
MITTSLSPYESLLREPSQSIAIDFSGDNADDSELSFITILETSAKSYVNSSSFEYTTLQRLYDCLSQD